MIRNASLLPCLLLLGAVLLPPVCAEEPDAAAVAAAAALDEQVEALYGKGQFAESVKVARKALAAKEALYGVEHEETAHSMNNLALCLQRMGEHDEALPLYERALEVATKTAGPDGLTTLSARLNLGMMLRALGRYEDARPYFTKSIAVVEAKLGPEDPMTGIVWNNMALLLQDLGEFEEALAYLERVVPLREKVLGAEHPSTGVAWNNLGHLLQTLGDMPRAEAALRRSLAIRQKSLGPDHPATATSLNNVALLLWALGRAEEGVPLLEQAVAIREARLGREHPYTGIALGNLALLLKSLGQSEAARSLYEKGLEILRAKLGDEHPAVGTALNNLGVLLMEQDRSEEARPYVERALAVRVKARGAMHPSTVQSRINLALVMHDLGELASAQEHYAAIAEDLEAGFGKEHPYLASTLLNLGDLHREAGRHAEAIPLYERALAIRRSAFGPDHASAASVNGKLGLARLGTGDADAARAALQRGLDQAEASARSAMGALHGPERLLLMARLRDVLAAWLRACESLDDSGYAAVLRMKGLVSRLERDEHLLLRQGDESSRKRVEELRTARRRLATLANDRTPRFRPEARRAWQQEYARLSTRLQALNRELAAEVTAASQAARRSVSTPADVQGALPADGAFIDLLRNEDRYLAWLVHPEGEVLRVDLGAASEIDAACKAFVDALSASAADGDDAWRTAGDRVRRLVWAPLAKHLRSSVKRLHLSPDAALATIAWSALPSGDGEEVLGDRYPITLYAMAEDCSARHAAHPFEGDALFVGDVNFQRATDQGARPAQGFAAAPGGGRFARLHASGAEVERLKGLWGERGRTLMGEDATEAALARASAGAQVLHLATHGFVRADLTSALRPRRKEVRWLGGMEERHLSGYDPRLLAGLALAGANSRQGGGEDDGILTALEVAHLPLDDCDLVVLSACQSALGRATSGEGVLGLVQGFQLAGARSLVASLWRVDDEATRFLMEHFYENLLDEDQPRSVTEALREAARTVRAESKWAAPCYWAAFVAYER